MIYERIKTLCKKQGISINKLESTLKIAKGSLCRIDINKPSVVKLQKIADYFNISLEYLLHGKDSDKPDNIVITSIDEREISKDLDKLMHKLDVEEAGPATYDGETLSQESLEIFRDELEIALRRLKLINKKKYNPNKNKK